jgi:hypothetical protein
VRADDARYDERAATALSSCGGLAEEDGAPRGDIKVAM